jgi:hypothetical protein
MEGAMAEGTCVLPVTQFLYPNGRQEPMTCEVPDPDGAVARGYAALTGVGCRLTAEVLPGRGEVSMCVEDPEMGDYANELVPNGRQVPLALAEMVRRFDVESYRAWRDGGEDE